MLHLYNTMSRRKEVFEPLDDKQVKMFTCGPSIYRRPHVGNYRSFLWEDVLQRYLEYQSYEVRRVINFTDVEDKAIAEAEKEGEDVAELTGRVADHFFNDTGLLRIKLPPEIPRSSTSVDQAVELIKILLGKKIAYWHDKDVFFDPLKFEGFGRLYRLDMSRWPKEKKRFRRDTYPGRRWNLGDFILWHGRRDDEGLFWETDIGQGRPSWNIQDPAMVTKHLGYRIDIACGGIDNIYRHHDYNLAVIEAASGEEFSRYWVHGEHLLADGKKMSKSKGNIIYPEDLLQNGLTPLHVRFYLLYGHHRKRMNLTMGSYCKTAEKLDAFRKTVQGLLDPESAAAPRKNPEKTASELIDGLLEDFKAYMDDDLRIQGAFDAITDGVLRLASLKRDGRLTAADCRKIQENLGRIDQVLLVIFP